MPNEINNTNIFKHILPDTIKEIILVLLIIILLYFLYENHCKTEDFKKENITINNYVKKIINGDSHALEEIKKYYNDLETNEKTKNEIIKFKNNKKIIINKDVF